MATQSCITDDESIDTKGRFRILVCGDRHYDDINAVYYTLSHIARLTSLPIDIGSSTIIHGGCKGADTIAGNFASGKGIECVLFSADWQKYGRSAGPIRNKQMIEEGRPNLVVAFHKNIRGSRGTKDMIERSLDQVTPTYLVSEGPDSISKIIRLIYQPI